MKTALVTGAARGIGKAIALRLAREGYSVAVHYHTSHSDAQTTCQELEALGVKAVALQADVRDPKAATALVQQATQALGGLGVLVNNVGNYIKRLA
jgi:3-oxoacyl-[acyl-carrier protein] reductase